MEIPRGLKDAVIAAEAGEIPVPIGNATIRELVLWDGDEAPPARYEEVAEEWIKNQIDLWEDVNDLILHLDERWPMPDPGLHMVFPPYYVAEWWFTVRYYPWATDLRLAIEEGWEWAKENAPPA